MCFVKERMEVKLVRSRGAVVILAVVDEGSVFVKSVDVVERCVRRSSEIP